MFSSHLCSGTTLGLIWQIDVLQLRRIPTVVDALLQLGRHLLQVGDGLGHRLLTFLYLFQLVVTVADGGYLHLVESTRTLLPITRDEGDGAALLKQGQRIGHSPLLKL